VEVAIKLEKDDEDMCTLDREIAILEKLAGVDGVPILYWSGFE
jgi:casein kinase I family protein HRR25